MVSSGTFAKGSLTWFARMPRRLPLVVPFTSREMGGPDQSWVIPETCQPPSAAFIHPLAFSKSGSS
jgi:hypothetical protein